MLAGGETRQLDGQDGSSKYAGMEAKIAALEALYSELPKLECKGLCQEVCGVVPSTPPEQWRVMGVLGHVPQHQGLECPLLVKGRCSVYTIRPLICRLFGMVKDDERMRCPHGCVPERWLTAKEAHGFISRAEEIAHVSR